MDGAAFDQQGFDAWLAGDPCRRPVFEAMQRRLMGSDMDAALRSYERRGAMRRSGLAGGVAAVFVAALGYAGWPALELQFAQPQSYTADSGTRIVDLADGTHISLARGARISVRYTGHDRVVVLERGTLFADVVHDTKRPFRIDTGEARIVDVGTSFEVSRQGDAVRVAVASGKVSFGRRGWFATPIGLEAKQAAMLDTSGLKRTADIDPVAVARWRGDWAEYKGTPLSQVVADLQAISPVPIEIADPALGDLPVSGRIRLSDPAAQLGNLAIIHDFHLRQSDGRMVLSRH